MQAERRASRKAWLWVALGDLCEVKGGDSAPQNKAVFSSDGIPFIRMQDIGRYHLTHNLVESNDRIADKLGQKLGLTLFPKGAILVPRSGSVYLNHRAILGVSAFVVSHIAALISTNPQIIVEYLYYYLCSVDMSRWSSKTTGLDSISFKSLKAIPVPLPPIPVQERIVQILQKADEICRKRKEALVWADAILRHLFIEMFGDPISNPKGWETIALGNVLELIRNGTTTAQNTLGKGFPVTRIETIAHEVINPVKVRYVELDDSELSKWRLLEGDILFSHINSMDHIGKTAIYRGDPPNLVHGMNLLLLRADRRECLPDYLHGLLKMRGVRDKLRSMARQAVNQASLNQMQLKSLLIPIPPVQLQERLVMGINQLQSTVRDLARSLDDCEIMMPNLMSRAFTGELTARWEAANAEEIAAQTAFYERLPCLLLLALLAEKTKRASQKAAQATVLVTALMKYAFLLQMEGASRRRLYHFVPYHYGPFAKELYRDLENLQYEGLVTVENDKEEDKTRITLADPARAAEALTELPEDLQEDVAIIIDTYGDLNHNQLLNAVYEKYPEFARKSLRRVRHKKE